MTTKPILCVVTGGRAFSDKAMVFRALDALKPVYVLHGGARGADTLSAWWAQERGVVVNRFPAGWKTHGLAAGPIRNREMLAYAKDLDDTFHVVLLAFPGGNGTRHCTRVAHSLGIEVKEVTTDVLSETSTDFVAPVRGSTVEP